MPYYHYTSRFLAQEIGCVGQLKPGASGRIYLTPQVYASGIDAAESLAITGKPVEIGIEVEVPSGIAVTTPIPVAPLRGPGGIVLRKGGGEEVMIDVPLAIPNPQKWISLIEP